MNHKVFRSIFILAVALGIVCVTARSRHEPTLPPTAARAPQQNVDPIARPLASYRVDEDVVDGGIDYRGANFKATVAESGCRFGRVPEAGSRTASREYTLEFGTPRVEQGSMRLECEKGKFVRAAFGVGQIDRGAVVEEYLFENRRVEQIFRFPTALAEGALRLCVPVKTDLTGPVVAHEPNSGEFEDVQFLKGGLAFTDGQGRTQLAYHSAVAIDAEGRQVALLPRHQSGEIVLEVPADFMAKAMYPVVIDPWLDFAGSGSGGGLTNNASASQRPALALTGGGLPVIAWSDNSAAGGGSPDNFDIYVKFWNGFSFTDNLGSASGGGISQNTGRSFNPAIAVTPLGNVAVAWEDDSSGKFAIYVRYMPATGLAGAGTWTAPNGSASSTGVNDTAGPAEHPTIGFIQSVVPGSVTFDPTTGVPNSTAATFPEVPVVAWEETLNGARQIYCRAFYPGAPAIPANPAAIPPTPALPAVPSGWYQMGKPGGVGTTDNSIIDASASISLTPPGFVSERPSMAIDSDNQISIAWQDTRNSNYEIYLSKWAANSTLFQVVAANTTRFDVIPAISFTAVSGSGAGGGISNTATPSQFPSLASDPTVANGLVVAWQETELSAVPNTASSSQIYVARSTGGGAWGGLAGSNAIGGISKTAAGQTATFPSVDVGGGYIGVAWADDTNQRSSIYVRRFFLGIGGFPPSTQWEQVGFQGSAFPAYGTDTIGLINGVSQSLNYAFQPQLKMDFQGSPTVAWADGSGATFDILMRTFSPNAPGVANLAATPPTFTITLRQTSDDPRLGPGLDVPVAGFSTGTSVFLSTRMFTETLLPAGSQLRLELEIQPAGAGFTFQPTHQTLFGPPDSPTTVLPTPITVLKFDGLPNANYHWQARTVDQMGRRSPWLSFGEIGGVSFRINSAAAPGGGSGSNGPANTNVIVGSGPKSKGSCGLTGLEAVALLAALRLIRRKRSA
jgi:hypothetical protein